MNTREDLFRNYKIPQDIHLRVFMCGRDSEESYNCDGDPHECLMFLSGGDPEKTYD